MIERVRDTKTFARLREEGTKVSSGSVSLIFVPVELQETQVAFALTRKFGNAVKRNRARRRIREAFRSIIEEQPEPVAGAFLVLAATRVISIPFSQLKADLNNCYSQVLDIR